MIYGILKDTIKIHSTGKKLHFMLYGEIHGSDSWPDGTLIRTTEVLVEDGHGFFRTKNGPVYYVASWATNEVKPSESLDHAIVALDEFAERAEIQTVTRYMDYTGGLHKTKFEACEEHIVGVRKRLQLAASTLTIQDPDRMIQLFNWIKEWRAVSAAYKAWLESTQVHAKDEDDDEEEE